MRTFARFIEEEVVRRDAEIDAAQVIVSDGLSLRDRAVRRILCTRVWRDGLGGVNNLDLARFRAEWNAGLVARRKIRAFEREHGTVDVLHFHRQSVAYGSLDRIRLTPTIISVDCTQEIVSAKASTAIERWSYEPNVTRDGRIFDAARLIIVTSRWAADSVRRQYPGCTTDITIMPDPVRLDAFDERWAAERVRRASQPGYKPRVLFMGGDFTRKGGYDLLRVWRDAHFADHAELHIVSDWPIEKSWLGPGVTHHTGITSRSERWRAMWREADIFALPTRDEAFGLVYQEAAAASLPSIGTAINAVPEIINNRRTGILVPPGDGRALAHALKTLIESGEVRHDMGSGARQQIVSTSDSGVYRRRLLDAIHAVTGNTRRHSMAASIQPAAR